MERCASCWGEIEDEETAVYDPDAGMLCEDCAEDEVAARAIRAMRDAARNNNEL